MKQYLTWLLASLLGFLGVSSCGPGGVFEDSSVRATREAQNAIYEETVNAVATQVSTITALQATADSASSMATQIVRMNAQNFSLEATIQALARGGPLAPNLQPQPPAAAPDGQAAASNQLFPNTFPPTPMPTPRPVLVGGVYLDATTALDVSNDDGCALDRSSAFGPQTSRIYLVVQAQQIQAGVTFYSRWLLNNETRFETVSWTSDQSYAELCIWFFITPQEVVLLAGNWTAQLIANETPVISASFVVEG